jgi:glycine dehydrogenase subunit 1
MHLSLLGPEGLARTAETSMQRAREAALALTALPGVSLYGDAPYGYEFALQLPADASALVAALARHKIIAGVPVGRWYKGLDKVLLVACTEKTTPAHIKKLAAAMAGALQDSTPKNK